MSRNIFLSLALTGLIGCAQIGGLDSLEQRQQRWRVQQEALGQIEQWDMYARAAVTLPGEAYNLGLQWRYQPDRFQLLIDAPFGQGVIRIRNTDTDSYRLQLPDGRTVANDSPEALLEDVIGWSIPVSGLEYWIRGMPRPFSNFTHRIHNSGSAREINQDDWVITYIDYFETSDSVSLPRRLHLAHDSVTMKLVIERWQQADIEDSDLGLFPEFN